MTEPTPKRGRGRPRTNNPRKYRVSGVAMTPAQWAWLDKEAKKSSDSRSALLRQMIDFMIEAEAATDPNWGLPDGD